MTAAPQTQSSLTHQAALENAELAELRQRGLRALDSMLRSQHRDAALAVWNLETETLMFANDLYLQLFDIPAMEAARGAITVARFLNTDAVFMHEDTLTQLKITRQCYVRYKRELLAGAMPGHGPRPFLCVTPTGRVQAGDMQIISLPNAEGRVREAIAVVLSHSGRHAASTAAHLPPPLSRTLSMPTPGPIAEPATPAEEEPWRRRGSHSSPLPLAQPPSQDRPPQPQQAKSSPHASVVSAPSAAASAAPAPSPTPAPAGGGAFAHPTQASAPVAAASRPAAAAAPPKPASRPRLSRRLPPEASGQLSHWSPHTYHIDSQSAWRVVQCDFCGTTVSPELRTGPRGSNTLCNRCGLQWAKKN